MELVLGGDARGARRPHLVQRSPPSARHDVVDAVLAGVDVVVIVTVEHERDVVSLEYPVEETADLLVILHPLGSRPVPRVMEEDDAEGRRLRLLEVLVEPFQLAWVVPM